MLQIPEKHSWLALVDLEEQYGKDFSHDHLTPWMADALARDFARRGLLARWSRQGAKFRAPSNRLV